MHPPWGNGGHHGGRGDAGGVGEQPIAHAVDAPVGLAEHALRVNTPVVKAAQGVCSPGHGRVDGASKGGHPGVQVASAASAKEAIAVQAPADALRGGVQQRARAEAVDSHGGKYEPPRGCSLRHKAAVERANGSVVAHLPQRRHCCAAALALLVIAPAAQRAVHCAGGAGGGATHVHCLVLCAPLRHDGGAAGGEVGVPVHAGHPRVGLVAQLALVVVAPAHDGAVGSHHAAGVRRAQVNLRKDNAAAHWLVGKGHVGSVPHAALPPVVPAPAVGQAIVRAQAAGRLPLRHHKAPRVVHWHEQPHCQAANGNAARGQRAVLWVAPPKEVPAGIQRQHVLRAHRDGDKVEGRRVGHQRGRKGLRGGAAAQHAQGGVPLAVDLPSHGQRAVVQVVHGHIRPLRAW